MQYSLYEIKDNAEGQLDSSISASDLVIPLKSGEGAEFPTTYTGNATSLGTSTTLNKTSIGASGITVGQFIENITDGSHAYVTAVDTNSLTTTTLEGGSDNTWQNNDEYAVGMFIVTLNKRNLTTGEITQSEKVKIKSRATDTLTAITGGRGFDGSTAAAYAADDYVSLFVTAKPHQEVKKAIAEQATNIKGLQATAPSALEKAALARLLDFDLTYSALSLDVDVEGGVYNNDGDASSDTPLTLAASQTNYIEVNQSTGVISSNTTSFSITTSLALWLVTTDGTGVTAVVDKRQVFGDYPGGESIPNKMQHTWTASENISVGDAIALVVSDAIISITRNNEEGVLGGTGVSQSFAQSFTPSVTASISSIITTLKKYAAPVDNLVIRIETNNAGNPSGTLVDANATFTISGATLTTSHANYTINAAGNFTLTAGTTYWMHCTRSGARDLTNNYAVGAVTAGGYSGGQIKSNDSGVWGAGAALDISLLTFNFSAGFACKTIASNAVKKKFVGFADETVTTGNPIKINIGGIDDNQSGLTTGATYILSGTGDIAVGTHPYTSDVIVGQATSATEINIHPGGYTRQV